MAETINYRAVSFSDAAAEQYPLPKYEADWEEALQWDRDLSTGVWRFEDDTPVEFIGRDGGEPEDQTLGRSWSWVVDALNDAAQVSVTQ